MSGKNFCNSVHVVTFVPLLLGGLDKASAVRSVAELAAWLGGLVDYPLGEFTKCVWEFLSAGGMGASQAPYESRLRMPLDLLGSSTRTVQSNGWTFLHCGSIAINESEELRQITALIRDLNKSFALSLDESPGFNRSPTASVLTVGGGKKMRFVVLGASHASRLANALAGSDFEVIDLSDRRWKLSKLGVEELVGKFEGLLPGLDRDFQLVLSVLDSALYWGETDEGAALAKKHEDNRFHLEGRVKLAGKEVVSDRFEIIRPLLLYANKFRVTLLSPLPRYIVGGCCENNSHCSNWDEINFATDQLRELERVRTNLRDCVFRAKDRAVKSVKVVNPVKLFGGGRDAVTTANALKAVWGGDPVHPTQAVYQRIAEELVAELAPKEEAGGGRGRKRLRSPEPVRDGSFSHSQTRANLGSQGWAGGGTKVNRGHIHQFRSGGKHGGGHGDYRGGGWKPRGGRGGHRGHRGSF